MGCQEKVENCFHSDHEEYVLCVHRCCCTPLQLAGRLTGYSPQMITNFAQGSDVFCVKLKDISFPNLLRARNYLFTACGIFRVNGASAGGCTLLSVWLL